MVKDKKEPVALEAYESLANEYAARIEAAPYNAYIERPAMLSLLPNVKGKHVLDAGCGSGFYSEILLNRGAIVTAIDVSPKMIHHARQRLGKRATIRLANLEEPLDFLADNSVDIVFSSLVLDYVRNWDSLFAEFSRILCDGGHFIFSTEHPFSKFTYKKHPERNVLAKNYFETEYMELFFPSFCSAPLSGGGVLMPSYRRPLSVFFECLEKAGFCFEKLIEPRPTEEFKRDLPDSYEETSQQPTFLCIRAHKGPIASIAIEY